MEIIRKAIRRRRVRRLNRTMDSVMRHVVAAGFSPVDLIEGVLREQFGVTRKTGESLNECVARAGGVPVADIERFMEALNAGDRVDGPEFTAASAIFDRIGRRFIRE